MAQPTVDQLLNMPWELIKIKGYERDLCYEVWLADPDIQYLVNESNFIGFINSNGTIHMASFFDMNGKDTSVELMSFLLDVIYNVNNHSLAETTRVEVAIQLIKANLTAALIISNSIEKVFKYFQFHVQHWTFEGETTQLHWETFTHAPVSISDTPLKYELSLNIKGVNNQSVSFFEVNICNWWTTQMNPEETVQEIVNNRINVEASITVKGRHINLNSTIKQFPKEIKDAIKDLI